MKLGIISDFHLGYERFREDAYKQAKEALIKASEISDILLIPGDIFDNRSPKPDVLAEGMSVFREIAGKEWPARVVEVINGKAYTDLPIVAISGTHERRAVGEENPVSLLNLAGLVVDASDAVVRIKKGSEEVAVRGIGGIDDRKVREYLASSPFEPVKGAFNVLMFHQSIYDYLPFSKEFISLDELPEGYDLYVCGHIHNRIEGKVHGKPFLIPGSTVLTQLKDVEQEPKGFYVFDTLSGKAEFHYINSRRFVVKEISVTGKKPSEVENEVYSSVSSEASKGDMPVVLVKLVGSLSQGFKLGDLSFAKLAKDFEGKAFVELQSNEIDEATIVASELSQGLLEGVSIKDYGLGVFVKKLEKFHYSLDVPAVELFRILSSESKDKAVAAAIELLFGKKKEE